LLSSVLSRVELLRAPTFGVAQREWEVVPIVGDQRESGEGNHGPLEDNSGDSQDLSEETVVDSDAGDVQLAAPSQDDQAIVFVLADAKHG